MLAEVQGQTPGPAADPAGHSGAVWYIVVHSECPQTVCLAGLCGWSAPTLKFV